jgi:hypothetical protein
MSGVADFPPTGVLSPAGPIGRKRLNFSFKHRMELFQDGQFILSETSSPLSKRPLPDPRVISFWVLFGGEVEVTKPQAT